MIEYKETPPDLLSLPYEDYPAPNAVDMEQMYPGIKFLPYAPTEKDYQVYDRIGLVTALYPRAVMPYDNMPDRFMPMKVRRVARAFSDAWDRTLGKVTFTTLKYMTGFTFEELFEVVLGAYIADWGVIRLGMNKHINEDGRTKYYYTTLHLFTTYEDRNNEKWHQPKLR